MKTFKKYTSFNALKTDAHASSNKNMKRKAQEQADWVQFLEVMHKEKMRTEPNPEKRGNKLP
jgi:hypothetical protein